MIIYSRIFFNRFLIKEYILNTHQLFPEKNKDDLKISYYLLYFRKIFSNLIKDILKSKERIPNPIFNLNLDMKEI